MAYTPKTLTRGYFLYTSDDGTVYEVATYSENGVNVNAATPITTHTDPAYPRGWVMRSIHGINVAGPAKTVVPIFDPADTKWTGSTGTFTKDGIVYTIQGRIGEKRTYKGG